MIKKGHNMALNRKSKTEDAPEGPAEWLLTYSDLVTLLLTFFVLLFSMATIDKQKFIEIANSLRSAFQFNSNGEQLNVNKGKDLINLIERNNSVDDDSTSETNNDPSMRKEQIVENDIKEIVEIAEAIKAQKLQEVKKKIEEAIEKLQLEEYIAIVEEKHSLILRISSVILFDLGSAGIKPYGVEILEKLGGFLSELDNDIMIQGHTCDLPINTKEFPSNWELSTKRATNVAKFFIEKCGLKPTKLGATGFAEFRPLKPNDGEANRQQNRRIDIVIDKSN